MNNNNNNKYNIDKELLPMKAHYFFYNAATAPVVPFMPTLARQLGFSSVIVGMIYAILPVIGMLAKPLFGFIADRYHRHRMLFILSEIITAIAFLLIMFIPPIEKTNNAAHVELHCHGGISDIRYCSAHNQCIVDNLQAHHANETLVCQLKCHANDDLWNTVCQKWMIKSREQCATTRPKQFIELKTKLDMNKINDVGQCLFFTLVHNEAYVDNAWHIMNCPADMPYFNASCTMACQADYLNIELQEQQVIPDNIALGLYQFWLFFALLVISWIGMAVTVSIGDAICFTILGERHHLYGKQRLYGSIGYGIFAIITGFLVDALSTGRVNKNYTIVFLLTAVIYCFDVYSSSKIKQTQTHLSTSNILRDISHTFLCARTVVYFLWCISIGLCTALVWNFLLIYLEELGSMQASCNNSMKTLEGIVLAIQSFGGDLPFFFISGWILKKIGHANAMSLVLLAFAVRFGLYSMLTDPWWVLPVELLNGITSGIFYATMASYANIIAPLGAEATMQGFVGAIFEGVGASIGSLIAGVMFDDLGGSRMFMYFAISALIAFVAHVLVQWFMNRYAIYDITKLSEQMHENNGNDNTSQSSLASLQPQN